MAVDLHTHSSYSDGSDRPERVVDLAVAAGLTAVALTDHDGVDGLEAAAGAAAGRIEFIPGTELSVDWEGRAMHLLAYWVETKTALAVALDALQAGRSVRNAQMVSALNALGIDITEDDVAAEAGADGVTGRPHIAAVLVARGVVASIPQAFDEYLAEGRPAYRGRLRLTVTDAVDLARRSGAVPVVAHPHTVADDADGFREAFERFAPLGIAGVECHYPEYAPAMRDRLAELARSLGLVPTGGSDYHGTYKEGLRLGVGYGDLAVPGDIVPELRERRTKPERSD